MKFVTKKEYEDAIATVRRAVDNKQIKAVFFDTFMSTIYFSNGQDICSANAVSFVAPLEAAKDKLFRVRNLLKSAREAYSMESKAIESLESEEKQLAQMLPLFKE